MKVEKINPMAVNLLTGKKMPRDWSCGAADLPEKARGYVPETWWNADQMEAHVTKTMSKGKGLFGSGPKPTRDEAIGDLAWYMKAHKIGPMSAAAGIGAEVGSILLPAKDQRRLMDKLDDVRYDVRGLRDTMGAALWGVAGATAVLGFAKIYKTARG